MSYGTYEGLFFLDNFVTLFDMPDDIDILLEFEDRADYGAFGI